MSELNGTNFGVNKVNFYGVQKSAQEVPASEVTAEENAPKLTDFSDPKAEALGRSMLFKGADNTKNDLKALLENPEIAENSDDVFEAAFKAAEDAGVENPYEEASAFATGNLNK